MNEHKTYNNFIKNKYYTWYTKIIDKAIMRNLEYNTKEHELHHALPKSLGGQFTVILTFREHYICHELLTRFTKGKDKMKMCFALHTFFHFDYHRPTISRSVLYERHRQEFKEACKERTPVTKKEIFIFKHMDSHEIFEGTRCEFKEHSKLSNQEIYNLRRMNSREICWNSKRWGIYNEKLKCFSFEIPRKPHKQKKKVCQFCGKSVIGINYTRWHGNNCKKINLEQHIKNTTQIRNLRKKSSSL